MRQHKPEEIFENLPADRDEAKNGGEYNGFRASATAMVFQ